MLPFYAEHFPTVEVSASYYRITSPDQARRMVARAGGRPEQPLVAEFRSRGWFNERMYALLRELRTGLCCVDAPPFPSLPPPVCLATSTAGRVRFHERNAAAWWHHATAAERYTHAYRLEELAPGILLAVAHPRSHHPISPPQTGHWPDPLLRRIA
ncbi:MAG: DUF72 domain-containing protein [Candidatus Methylomirabilales bacterium]